MSTSATLVEDVDAAETDVVLVMPVSAKFLRPDVCKSLFTGFTNSSYCIGLFTVYERF